MIHFWNLGNFVFPILHQAAQLPHKYQQGVCDGLVSIQESLNACKYY